MKFVRIRDLCLIALFALVNCFSGVADEQKRPNVILILTDDQGIGDLGCHGNPWLKTPNIDAFYEESVRFTDFHVSPLCTPTRAAIMTGRYPINNGAWATFKGRDALSQDPVTMADVFKADGYRTAMFGKWHLGDNYPVRPTDSGFETAVHHLAGGVGELSDYWGNSYFDDVYYVNNEPHQFEGYCTDVWFNETMKFIEAHKDEPFLVYLPTNAPHDPLIVDERYAEPYQHLEGEKIPRANFYGMIANIDENFGKLRMFLRANDLEENTILIFMTDNGSGNGYSRDGKLGFNKGFSGKKGDELEGGHRVPFFIHWPAKGISGGFDIHTLAAHVDLIPTLSALCGFELPEGLSLDGVDLTPLFSKEENQLSERSVFIHHRQDWRPPSDVQQTCIVKGDWRLVNGEKLFDVVQDPGQKRDVAAKYPEVVEELLKENEAFLRISKGNREYSELPVNVIGNDAQKEIKLTIQHAIGEDRGIWKCEQVSEGRKNRNNTHAIEVEKSGNYIISCRRWPKECSGPIWGIPNHNPKGLYDYQSIRPEKVRISIANQMFEKEISQRDEAVEFSVYLEKGKTFLTNDFIDGDELYGVYYTYIREAE